MSRLTADECARVVADLPGWTVEGDALEKTFTFEDFPEAVLFVSALVPGAEAADHHPDLAIHYRRVVVRYSTHSEGGITAKDVDGAQMADEVAAALPHLREFGDPS